MGLLATFFALDLDYLLHYVTLLKSRGGGVQNKIWKFSKNIRLTFYCLPDSKKGFIGDTKAGASWCKAIYIAPRIYTLYTQNN